MKTRERVKSLLLVALLVLAMLLLFINSFYMVGGSLASQNPWLNSVAVRLGLTHDRNRGEQYREMSLSVLPVKIAVRTYSGFYGVQHDKQAVQAVYSELSGALDAAFSSAESFDELSQAAYESSLMSCKFVFLEYGAELPYSVLAGNEAGDEAPEAGVKKIVLLSHDSEHGAICAVSESGKAFAARVSDEAWNLIDDAAGRFSPNGYSFACFLGDAYANVRPDTLIAEEPAKPFVLTAKTPELLSDPALLRRVQEQFHMNPYTVTDYEGTGKNRVFVEALNVLTVSENGEIEYSGMRGASGIPVAGYVQNGDERENMRAYILMGRDMIEDTATSFIGDAGIYLSQMQYEEGVYTLLYEYEVQNIPIEREGVFAGRLQIQNGAVIGARINLRAYSVSEEEPALLHEKHIAGALPDAGDGGEYALDLRYDDLGHETVTAQFFAREAREEIE